MAVTYVLTTAWIITLWETMTRFTTLVPTTAMIPATVSKYYCKTSDFCTKFETQNYLSILKRILTIMIYTQWVCKWLLFCTYPNDRIQLCHGDLLGAIHGRRHLLLVLQQTASPCHHSSFKASLRKENRHHMQVDPTDKREMNWIRSHSWLPDICRCWNRTPWCARKIMDDMANRTVMTRTIEHVGY